MTYRLYLVDGSGRIIDARAIEAADDVEAVTSVAAILNEHPRLELWERARYVVRMSKPHPVAA